jgi:glycine/D-amino acid oxidase-like deaminating enzyme
VARILIVGGGCRGRRLARELAEEGHAIRVTTRERSGCAAIEAAGAECWTGTPERLGTLRGALDGVAVACWLLASATGPAEELRELHTSRLEAFTGQLIDTTVRGFVYEAGGGAIGARPVVEEEEGLAVAGERVARGIAERNAIPLEVIRTNAREPSEWLAEARGVISRLLAG